MLRSSHTTGTHCAAAIKGALINYFTTNCDSIGLSIKGYNDDLDVTKGCKIVAKVFKQIPKKIKNQKPILLEFKTNKVYIFAGDGVGVVTKNGLKNPPQSPAINPAPILSIKESIKELFVLKKYLKIYITVSIVNGEEIAKNSANFSVGIIGGLSILGTTGTVKPISNSAYLETIKTHLNFAFMNGEKVIVFTLGNSAYKIATEKFNNFIIIECGNFVYDSLTFAKEYQFEKIYFLSQIGKLTKLAQGFKNTHNRFGSIDFKIIENWLNIDLNEINTVKRVCEILGDQKSLFIDLVKEKASKNLNLWYEKNIVEVECVW